MRAILSTIRFLGRQGLPLRGTFFNDDVEGGSESNSNFLQLLHLRANDIPQLKEWLKKARDKFTSPSIQNELLEIMALDILRKINRDIKGKFFSIMVDETTDTSNIEQLVFMWMRNSTVMKSL